MKLGKYIAGALSGLTFGLLFAPKKGEDLRQEIKKKGGKSKQEGLNVLIDAFKEAGTEAIEEAKAMAENQSLEEAIGNSKEKMREYFSQIERTGQDIAARAKEKLDELHQMASEKAASFKKTAVKKASTVKKSAKAAVKKAANTAPKAKKVTRRAARTSKRTAKPKTTSATMKTTVKKIKKTS